MVTALLLKTQEDVRSLVGNTYYLREYLNHREQTAGSNMDVKGTTSEG